MIKLQGLSKIYYTPAGEFPALRNIDLEIAAGEFVAIVGKSGSGKSTLLNLMGGIDSPTSGTVEVGGKAIQGLNQKVEEQRAELQQKQTELEELEQRLETLEKIVLNQKLR